MLRRTSRLAALLAMSAALLPLALVSRLLALAGARATATRLAAALQARWGSAILAILGTEIDLEGELPRGAFVVVANHLSYFDVPVLSALVRGRFVAKSEIAGWPLLGQLASVVGTIFILRARRRDVLRVEREMTRTLAAGVPVVLFPEGHSTRGLGVDRLHSSLLECAAREQAPCVAIALGYETPWEPWAPAATVCWWGGMGFGRHAWTLMGLRHVRARVRVAATVRRGTDRKLLAGELQADLARLFVPVRQAPIAPDYPWPELFARSGSGPGASLAS